MLKLGHLNIDDDAEGWALTTVETQKEGSRKEEANSELHAKYLEFGGV